MVLDHIGYFIVIFARCFLFLLCLYQKTWKESLKCKVRKQLKWEWIEEPGNVSVVLKQFQDIHSNCSGTLKWNSNYTSVAYKASISYRCLICYRCIITRIYTIEMTESTYIYIPIARQWEWCSGNDKDLHFVCRVHPSCLALARSSHTRLPSFVLHLHLICICICIFICICICIFICICICNCFCIHICISICICVFTN